MRACPRSPQLTFSQCGAVHLCEAKADHPDHCATQREDHGLEMGGRETFGELHLLSSTELQQQIQTLRAPPVAPAPNESRLISSVSRLYLKTHSQCYVSLCISSFGEAKSLHVSTWDCACACPSMFAHAL
eukprot:4856004-Pleurochrysis_carterae.AAC.3